LVSKNETKGLAFYDIKKNRNSPSPTLYDKIKKRKPSVIAALAQNWNRYSNA